MKPRRPQWTPEQDAQLCELVAQERSFREIGAIMDRSASTVAERFKRISRDMGSQAA